MIRRFTGTIFAHGENYNKIDTIFAHVCSCGSKQYSVVKPGIVSPIKTLPPDIEKPSYASKSWFNFVSGVSSWIPQRKDEHQVQGMRDACAVARDVLLAAGQAVRPGVTTEHIDDVVHSECIKHGAYPSPLLYKGFPKSVCTSVNNVACHGIPDNRPLENGDIINIDVTVYYGGYHGDTSDTFIVGSVDPDGRSLVEMARFCRDQAIHLCGPDVPLSDIGGVISYIASEVKLEIIPDFCGHGIGSYFHGPPNIVHVANDFPGKMKEGMTFTIEPILSEGNPAISILEDGWTAVSEDHSRSAQAEHTILITSHGADVLTK